LPGICKKDGHGAFPRKECPICCFHKGQVYLDNGPHCEVCGRAIFNIRAAQLIDVEKQLKGLAPIPSL